MGLKKLKLGLIKESLKMTKGVVRDNFFGLTESISQDNGKEVRNMEMDIGNLKKVKVIWVNGPMDRFLDMECTI